MKWFVRYSTHTADADLLRFRDHQLPAKDSRRVAEHVAACERCRLAMHRLEAASRFHAAMPGAAIPSLEPSLSGMAGLLESARQLRASLKSPEVERQIAEYAASAVRYYLGATAASHLLALSFKTQSALLPCAESLLAGFLGLNGASAITSRIAQKAASDVLVGGRPR